MCLFFFGQARVVIDVRRDEKILGPRAAGGVGLYLYGRRERKEAKDEGCNWSILRVSMHPTMLVEIALEFLFFLVLAGRLSAVRSYLHLPFAEHLFLISFGFFLFFELFVNTWGSTNDDRDTCFYF